MVLGTLQYHLWVYYTLTNMESMRREMSLGYNFGLSYGYDLSLILNLVYRSKGLHIHDSLGDRVKHFISQQQHKQQQQKTLINHPKKNYLNCTIKVFILIKCTTQGSAIHMWSRFV